MLECRKTRSEGGTATRPSESQLLSPKAIAGIERITWILIYAGLFAIVLGIASGGTHRVAGWSLGVLGGIAVATGIVLVWVRSRLRESEAGAESKTPSEGTRT